MNFWLETSDEALTGRDRRGRLPAAQRRGDPRADRGAQPGPGRSCGDGAGPGRGRRQAGRVRRRALLAGRVLRDPGLPARGRPRPDRRRGQLRGRAFSATSTGAGRRATRCSTHAVLRQAMAYGSVLASFNVEDFGTERVASLTREEIDQRLRDFRRITHFEAEPAPAPVVPPPVFAATTAVAPRRGRGRAGSRRKTSAFTRPLVAKADRALRSARSAPGEHCGIPPAGSRSARERPSPEAEATQRANRAW